MDEAPSGPTFKRIAWILGTLYKENIFDLLDEGPDVRDDATLDCVREVLHVFFALHSVSN